MALLNLSDEEKIVRISKDFLQARITRLEQYDSPIDFLTFFDPDSQQFRHLQYMSDRIELEAGLRRANNAQVMKSEHHLKHHLVGISGDYAEITFFERYEYVLKPVPEFKTSETTRYEMALSRVNGTWLLSDIITDSDFDDAFRDTDVDVKTFLDSNLKRKKSVPPTEYLGPDMADMFPVFTPYNIEKAVAYAEKYALSYNPLFYSYKGLGGDCQNFASQCVWAGLGGENTATAVNLKMPPMVRSGPRAWYQNNTTDHDPYGRWIAVQPFSAYILSGQVGDLGPVGTVTNGLANAATGDLIAISDGKRWFHIYVVVAHTGVQGMRTTKDLWVSAHTTDRNRQWLATLITDALPVRTIHIIGGVNNAGSGPLSAPGGIGLLGVDEASAEIPRIDK